VLFPRLFALPLPVITYVLAVRWYQLESTVKRLLECGADVSGVGSDGLTALHMAADVGSLPMCRFLAQHMDSVSILHSHLISLFVISELLKAPRDEFGYLPLAYGLAHLAFACDIPLRPMDQPRRRTKSLRKYSAYCLSFVL